MKRLLGLSALLIVGLTFITFSILAQEKPLGPSDAKPAVALSRQVEIIRTAHGVPHIRAENLRAAGYALGWLQLEDYGARAAMMTLRSRGDMGKLYGHDSIEGDFANRARHNRAAATYNQLEQPTRDVYEGF